MAHMIEENHRDEAIQAVNGELLAFKKSPLYGYRIENGYIPVVGEGSYDAHIMFVGEAPGETEAKTGKPFCGRSGKMLDQLLASIGMDRAKVYVTNLVNDRPHDNRDPSPQEIALYAPFLDRQIEVLKPRVIATLGRHSMKYIFERFGLAESLDSVSKIHGKEFKTQASYGEVTIIALYHPATALYNGGMKQILLDDFKALKKYL